MNFDRRAGILVVQCELQLLNVALLAGSDAWVELPNVLGLVVCLVAAFELACLALRRRDLA